MSRSPLLALMLQLGANRRQARRMALDAVGDLVGDLVEAMRSDSDGGHAVTAQEASELLDAALEDVRGILWELLQSEGVVVPPPPPAVPVGDRSAMTRAEVRAAARAPLAWRPRMLPRGSLRLAVALQRRALLEENSATSSTAPADEAADHAPAT